MEATNIKKLLIGGLIYLTSLSVEAEGNDTTKSLTCLQETNIVSQESKIDWTVVGSQQDLEQCSFEVAMHLASKEALVI